jgi:hypothetical protein
MKPNRIRQSYLSFQNYLSPALGALFLLGFGSACSFSRVEEKAALKVSIPKVDRTRSHTKQSGPGNSKNSPNPQSGSRILLNLADAFRPRSVTSGLTLRTSGPEILRSPAQTNQRSDSSTFQNFPTSLDDFDCFSLNVLGTGINSDPRLPAKFQGSCGYPEEIPLGAYFGMVSVTEGELEISIPSGAKRTIQVQAFRSKTGTCPTLDSLIATYPEIIAGKNPNLTSSTSSPAGGSSTSGSTTEFPLSEPLEIGRVTIDLTTDTTVMIPISFDPLAPKRVICSSSESAPAPIPIPTPTPEMKATWDSALWDEGKWGD